LHTCAFCAIFGRKKGEQQRVEKMKKNAQNDKEKTKKEAKVRKIEKKVTK
jgi:hypothetical protein